MVRCMLSRRAYDVKQTAEHDWCRGMICTTKSNWGQFVLSRAEAQKVNDAAREVHNERNRNTLKHSTCE